MARSVAESKLLAGIKAELAASEYLEEFKRTVRQVLADERATRSAQRDFRAKREIEHMAGAVAAGLLSPTLRAKLEAAEGERSALAVTTRARLADTYSALAENLERVPRRYVDRATTNLKGLIGEVRLIPEGPAPMAEFELEGARLLAAADMK